MWSPTHIKVTIRSARNILCKGKNNTNNCFVTIGLGKEKYQTSVKEKSETNVAWNEECELKIPDQGNRAELVLTCLHRNNLGLDEFLGQVTLPLNEMDAYDRPRAKWYKLESKPGKEKKNKERGELDVLISFTVKSGSLTDLSKKEKHKSSIGKLASSVGGSLLSIGTIEKRKGIKKYAKKFGSKLHISGSGKKKNKDEDDMSYNGSFASIGTPNRIRVPDSEDEDEFPFDELSQKSSVSSLNLNRDSLQAPQQNYGPRNPSPLLGGSTGKGQIGKDQRLRYDGSDNLSVDPELEKIESEFSIRARTLPPPSKPPRTPLMDGGDFKSNGKQTTELDEWESKLYGRSAESSNSDSLKRRSWEPVAVPLTTTNDESLDDVEPVPSPMIETDPMSKSLLPTLREGQTPETFTDTSSSSSEEDIPEKPKQVVAPIRKLSGEKTKEVVNPPVKPTDLQLGSLTKNMNMKKKDSLLSPDTDDFAKFNASFAEFEQKHSAKFFNIEEKTNDFLKNESQLSASPQPLPKPRARITPNIDKNETSLKFIEEEKRQRAAEDARLEAELQANEKRLREEEAALQQELDEREEEKRREAKRRDEDLRILNFSKRLVSQEEKPDEKQREIQETKQEELTIKPIITNGENKEEMKIEIKERQINNREKLPVSKASTPSPKHNERIIIGHEKSSSQAERRAEISAALAKKYDGKSREELMLIANGMENEALIQRQRVKELEDYLDNLLLRVMETHPKILQNPYSRTTSAKSG